MNKLRIAFKNTDEAPIAENQPEKDMVQIDANLLKQFTQVLQALASGNNQKNVEIDVNALAAAIATGMNGTPGATTRRIFTADTIPVEDLLEKPAMFFSFSYTTTVYDDVVKGVPIQCPLAPVVFKPAFRYEDPTRRGNMITQCMAVVYSKSQANFIRNHSLFGIKYFENFDVNKRYSVDILDKVVASYNIISGFTDYQIKQKCLELGINIDTNDFKILRRRIAHKMAEELQRKEADIRQSDLEDIVKSQAIKEGDATLAEKTYL